MVHQQEIMVQLETQFRCQNLARIKYRMARNGYRRQGDRLSEATCFANQAEVFWQYRLDPAFVLGIARYSLLLLERLTQVSDENLVEEICRNTRLRLDTLTCSIRHAYDEETFVRLWLSSEKHVSQAREEEEEERRRWAERHKDLAPTIEACGLPPPPPALYPGGGAGSLHVDQASRIDPGISAPV